MDKIEFITQPSPEVPSAAAHADAQTRRNKILSEFYAIHNVATGDLGPRALRSGADHLIAAHSTVPNNVQAQKLEWRTPSK